MSATTEALTSRDMLDGLDVSYRQLDHWCRQGLFGDASANPGSGSWRRFEPEERRVLAVIAKVSAVMNEFNGQRGGLSTDVLRLMAAAVRAHPDVRFFSVMAGPRVEPGCVGLAAGCALVFDVDALERAA